MKLKVIKKQNNSKSCIVCGMENSLGLKAAFYELENNDLVAICTLKKEHQSYPERAHGGMIAAILDETIGRSISINQPMIWGVTIGLSIQYKKAVPLNETLKIVGRITNDSKRIFEGYGEIILSNGEICATATGKYMKMSLEKISDPHFIENEWFLNTTEDDPIFIDL